MLLALFPRLNYRGGTTSREKEPNECNFHPGTMPVSGIMRRGSDIFSKGRAPRERRKGEGRGKKGGGEEDEEEGRGEKEENKFAGTGETTRARRESVEKRFLAV